jgi:hypothetical protein
VLVGWGQSVSIGNRVTSAVSRYLSWYPPELTAKRPVTHGADVYMAAQCILYLAGGDPTTGTIPAALHHRIAYFLRGCLLESPNARGHARVIRDSLDRIARQVYGPPKFITLEM